MNENPAALLASARRAMAAGDFASAQGVLLRALDLDKQNIAAWLNLAATRRQMNDTDGAFEALREVLRLESRNFHALLMSASLLERRGSKHGSASMYGAALANAPPEQYLDPATRQALHHGRDIHSKYTLELDGYIREKISAMRGQYGPASRRRIDAFIGTTLRTRKRYKQEPSEYFYPGLPAIEFYEREEFPWLEELEAATPDIQQELQAILREDERSFKPYIHYADHMPLDQWRELNHSPRWSAFHFYEAGVPVEDRCRRAPATLQAIAKLPQARVPRRSPSALFSVLQPNTHIPAHTGVANFRLVVHLPLILPEGCRFRVGGETREWRMGNAWVFDDTIEHEAWNDGDRTRVILICDIWNPRLPEEERELIAEVIAATDAFKGIDPQAQQI